MMITEQPRPSVLCWSVVALALYAAPATGAETKTTNVPDARVRTAIELMDVFAERTGLTSDRPPQRYLWTDAFAVCNYLGLERATGDARYRQLALRLVDQVHHVLGRHRADERRTGWISGLGDSDAQNHPTQSGLRIGKKLPERGPKETIDENLEWDRDGQYFHYLTKWMQALDLVARTTGDQRFSRWARELAAKSYAGFSYAPPGGGPPRLYWKMSIELTRPLVPSMGQHDPLDGFVTFVQLQTTPATLASPPLLDKEIAGLASMMQGRDWTTSDPLGLGALLIDAYRVQELLQQGAPIKPELLEQLLEPAAAGLSAYAKQDELKQPASTRLAFRELGLAIGLQAAERTRKALLEPHASPDPRKQLDAILRHVSLRTDIETFWLNAPNRRAQSWTEHQDINEVMLATSLAPDGCLALPPLR